MATYQIPHIPTAYNDIYKADRELFLRHLNKSSTPFEALVRLWCDIAQLRPMRHVKLNQIPKSTLYLRTDVGYRSVVSVENEAVAAGIDTLAFLLQPECPPHLFHLSAREGQRKGIDLVFLEPTVPVDGRELTLGQFLVLQSYYKAATEMLYEAQLPLVFTPTQFQLQVPADDDKNSLKTVLTELRDTCYRMAEPKPMPFHNGYRPAVLKDASYKHRVAQAFPEPSHICALLYAAGAVEWAAKEWPEVFPKSSAVESEGGGSINLAARVDLTAQTQAMLRLLTHGDITKENAVLDCPLSSAMAELTAQIRESKALKKMKKKK